MTRPLVVVLRRLLSRARRDRLDDELRDEIAQHIAFRERQLIGEGMDPREAAYEARRMFGNPTVIREETREMWTFRWIETLGQDTRFGARLLRRSPVFTVAAVASLAIGIGSASAVFSLADTLLFRQLPVRSPQELVLFRWVSGPELPFESLNGFGTQTSTETSSTSFALNLFESMRSKLADQIEVVGFADLYRVNLSIDGRPDMAYGQVVSGNYFSVLGITPAAGRLLAADDDRADAAPAAVIGYDFWQRRFGGDHTAVGRALVLNGVAFTVVGVLPRGFAGTLQVGQPCDVIVPLSTYKAVTRSDDDPASPRYWWVLMMGRLKPGVTAARVQPAADLLLKQTSAAARPGLPADKLPRMSVEPGAQGQTDIRNGIREPLKIMAAVVSIVLLVACANVANLLLARGRARRREVAVRSAIGADRARIMRQFLTEGLLLGLLASTVGLVLAQWISSALRPALTPDLDEVAVRYAVDLRMLAFTCGLGTACSVLFALFPASKATDASLAPALQESSRGTVGDRSRFAAGGALVVAQVALSMLLLSAAALLAWSAQRLQHVDPGFDAENLLTFSVETSLNGYDRVRSHQLIARALDDLRALPGVSSASVTDHRLIANSSSMGTSRTEGTPPMDPASPEARAFSEKNRTWRLVVDDRFFDTFRIPLLRGRTFPPAISTDGPALAVVNEALARQLFGTSDVVGRRFAMGVRAGARPIEIIGVAADARYTSLRRDPPPTAYFPYQQSSVARLTFAVRASVDPLSIAGSAREVMRRIDNTLPVFNLMTQQDQIRRSLAQERLFAKLAVLLGAVTLALSGIGLYGLLAYAVTRRTPEIGVRIALGAERRQVRWMIMRQSVILVVCGLALGIPGAAASARFVESLLFGLSPYDPRAIAAAALIMLAVALAAAYVPARRASRIDPLSALRAEQ